MTQRGPLGRDSQKENSYLYPTGDLLISEEDLGIPDFLTLKMKKEEEWIVVHQGTRRIPIGNASYRLKNVSDDGYLVELEKEK